MENSATTIENLIEKAEVYAKTSLELYKYTTVSKSADMFSALAVRLVITIVIALFTLFMNIGLAIWIGRELGSPFYGFFAIAGCYLLLAALFYAFRKQWIKTPISNFIINRILKHK